MYRKQGSDLYKASEFSRALEAFEKGLKFAPPGWPLRAQVLGNRAATLMMVHRYQEAADDCAEALRLDPTMAKLHTRRGRALLRLGLFAAADEAFQRVLVTASGGVGGAGGVGTRGVGGSGVAGGAGEDREVEAAKTDARNGLKALAGARSAMKRLGQLECAGDYTGVLVLVADLQLHCPACSAVHVSRCTALCKLQKWGDAKAAVEEFVCVAHSSVLGGGAHPAAVFPPPPAGQLVWGEKTGKTVVAVDTDGVVQA